jgi:hypothetical protein
LYEGQFIMALTTFSGPVASQNGFEGNITGNVTAQGFVSTGVMIITGIPTVDPMQAGLVWNDAGTLKVSAGA